MTSSITTVRAVTAAQPSDSNRSAQPEFGLRVLREHEAEKLISLVCEAQHQAAEISSEMHRLIYQEWDATSRARLEGFIIEAQACMQAAHHYLLMLGSVNDERSDPTDVPPENDPDEEPF